LRVNGSSELFKLRDRTIYVYYYNTVEIFHRVFRVYYLRDRTSNTAEKGGGYSVSREIFVGFLRIGSLLLYQDQGENFPTVGDFSFIPSLVRLRYYRDTRQNRDTYGSASEATTLVQIRVRAGLRLRLHRISRFIAVLTFVPSRSFLSAYLRPTTHRHKWHHPRYPE